MRRIVFLLGMMMPVLHLQAATFQAKDVDVRPWKAILGSVGISADENHPTDILLRSGAASLDVAALSANKILILEGNGPAAEQAGVKVQRESVRVRQIADIHAPEMQIFWEQPQELSQVTLDEGYQVFAKEKWKGIPVLAGKRTAHGAILWVATSPGSNGTERFPYLLEALKELGWQPSAETVSLEAFFDSSYRIRADPEYLAARWRRAGIGTLHIAAWHNMEADATQDEYLRKVIAACHRNAILVYAWLELPHVSEKFWADHPMWREKTAVGQDAQLDWRKLMNLQNADCRKAIADLTTQLIKRFDWDGVNLAELYFESLEGAANPARLTPMNNDIRAEFQQKSGFDPKELFTEGSAHYAANHPEALRKFLDYRAELAARMQREWLGVVEQSQQQKPYLAITLTHIDDRFETGIRDQLGADVARTLPVIEAGHNTLLVEDPAPLWALGPERYAKLADKYKELTATPSSLAVDINVVERYQDVYPTKKQTGTELFELVHQAAVSFGKVALYFENSLERQDLSLLPVAATSARVDVKAPDEFEVECAESTRILWQGAAELDGKPWPIQDSTSVLVPAGKHKVSTGLKKPPFTIKDFNGNIWSVITGDKRLDVSYASRTRTIAILESPVKGIEVDGFPLGDRSASDTTFLLPSGQHIVSFIH
jgi:hypothetical protein